MDEATTRVAALNDALRTRGIGGRVSVTAGIEARGPAFAARVVEAVQAFDAFTPENDPYGERDFGSFELADATVFWKIECYDRAMAGGSEDPADPLRTTRVLTVMLAEEY